MLSKLLGYNVAIDLGTVNSVVVQNGKVIAREPTTVAYDLTTGDKYFGWEAERMHGLTPENIKIVRPMVDGKISDIGAVEHFLTYLLNIASFDCLGFKMTWPFGKKAIIAIPCELSSVHKSSVREMGERLGFKTSLIIQPVAAALYEIDEETLEWSRCVKVVDIGGGTTDIVVITMLGIIGEKGVAIAGNEMDDAIKRYVEQTYHITISDKKARDLKHTLGCALPMEESRFVRLKAHDAQGEVKEMVLTDSDIREVLSKPLNKILDEVRRFNAEQAEKNPEITTTTTEVQSSLPGAMQIEPDTVLLTGGGSGLPRLADFFRENLDIGNVVEARNPLEAAALGADKALNNPRLLRRYQAHVSPWGPLVDARFIPMRDEEETQEAVALSEAQI